MVRVPRESLRGRAISESTRVDNLFRDWVRKRRIGTRVVERRAIHEIQVPLDVKLLASKASSHRDAFSVPAVAEASVARILVGDAVHERHTMKQEQLFEQLHSQDSKNGVHERNEHDERAQAGQAHD